MSRDRLLLGLIVAVAAATVAVFAGSTLGKAQNNSHMSHAQHVSGNEAALPTMPGQEAFGTIQEIVRILEADPTTDWSKVNIAALREHLIDMDEVTMRAVATERALDNGIEIAVTGDGRTLDAIKRMVPAHAHELAAIGWQAKTEDLPNGVKLVVTSDGSQAGRSSSRRSASWASWCRARIISRTISRWRRASTFTDRYPTE